MVEWVYPFEAQSDAYKDKDSLFSPLPRPQGGCPLGQQTRRILPILCLTMTGLQDVGPEDNAV